MYVCTWLLCKMCNCSCRHYSKNAGKTTTNNLCGRWYYPHFRDVNTEAQGHSGTRPGWSLKMAAPGLKTRSDALLFAHQCEFSPLMSMGILPTPYSCTQNKTERPASPLSLPIWLLNVTNCKELQWQPDPSLLCCLHARNSPRAFREKQKHTCSAKWCCTVSLVYVADDVRRTGATPLSGEQQP